jgi:hypothetical protein
LALNLSRQEARAISRSTNRRDQYAAPPRFEDLFQIGPPSARAGRNRGARDGDDIGIGLEQLFTAILGAGMGADSGSAVNTTTTIDRNGNRVTRTSTGSMGARNMATTHRIQLGGPGQSQGRLFSSRRSPRPAQPAAFGGPRVLLHSSGQEEPRLVPLMDLFGGLNMLLMAGRAGAAPDPQDERYWQQNLQPAR